MAKDVNRKSERNKQEVVKETSKLQEKQKNEERLLVTSDNDEKIESDDSQGNKKKKSKPQTDKLLTDAFKKLSLQATSKPPLKETTFECFISTFKEKNFENIITISGAGISTSAGIPDFRTPIHGLYDNLSKYDLPYPQAIFDYSYFLENPAPFFDLAKQLLPGKFKPTFSHYFIKLLERKGLLLRHYTQNIDGLERLAGISEDLLVEAHGTFYTSHCLKCNNNYTFEWLRECIINEGIPKCVVCDVVVKPDIVFFGENLPKKFSDCIKVDFPKADLLIIMGSSLVVEPFASIVKRVHKKCPRIIINNQEVGKKVGLVYDVRRNERDVFLQGTCDDGCLKIITEMGWNNEINQIIDEVENTQTVLK